MSDTPQGDLDEAKNQLKDFINKLCKLLKQFATYPDIYPADNVFKKAK
jgi:predicted translin family RNA/ssDNA-binding protein